MVNSTKINEKKPISPIKSSQGQIKTTSGRVAKTPVAKSSIFTHKTNEKKPTPLAMSLENVNSRPPTPTKLNSRPSSVIRNESKPLPKTRTSISQKRESIKTDQINNSEKKSNVVVSRSPSPSLQKFQRASNLILSREKLNDLNVDDKQLCNSSLKESMNHLKNEIDILKSLLESVKLNTSSILEENMRLKQELVELKQGQDNIKSRLNDLFEVHIDEKKSRTSEPKPQESF